MSGPVVSNDVKTAAGKAVATPKGTLGRMLTETHHCRVHKRGKEQGRNLSFVLGFGKKLKQELLEAQRGMVS